jgi:hypothetical protein
VVRSSIPALKKDEGGLPVEDDVVVDRSTVTPDVAAPDLSAAPAAVSAATERFQACRWRKAAENGTPECCGHRDVLPMTGANGFDAGAWCPDCGLYKLRRTPKKRDDYGMGY